MFDNPETTIPEMRSWTGLKTVKALEIYIGYSKRRMQKAKARLKEEIDFHS
jgi:hypothetical protein